jgi:hypothetical protein
LLSDHILTMAPPHVPWLEKKLSWSYGIISSSFKKIVMKSHPTFLDWRKGSFLTPQLCKKKRLHV